MSGPAEVWVSDGLPSVALERFLTSVGPSRPSRRRLPLVGGVTVWDDPPMGSVSAAVACPNRLGVFEPLPPPGWQGKVWWWSDPLSVDRSRYRSLPGADRISARAPLPTDRSLTEAVDRSRRAADYLTRRLRHLRGVRIPSVSHGRRFPMLLPVTPDPLLRGVTEELIIPRPVDGWPGLVVCEVGWWQSRNRLDALVKTVRRAVEGDRPAPLDAPERVWSSPGP